MSIHTSIELYDRALRKLVGGVNSPVRSFGAVGGTPIFIREGRGSRVVDEDGNEYIDYVCSWGALILGHAHPRVVEAVKNTVEKGTSFGIPTSLEVELAEMLCEAFPSIEKVRLVNSGTEATMSALRLARAYTGRTKFIKFDGCYHGHADSFLVKAGSGATTLGVPDSPGVPALITAEVMSLPYNSLEAVEKAFEINEGEIAAVFVEPVAANMGVVLPKKGFLEGLRAITRKYGALLIFDEVITGFRLAYGGAQTEFGIDADITILGKIIGGGLPVGAYGGKADIMHLLAPEGPVYQAGTLSGNPLAVSAGIATLSWLKENNPYKELARKTKLLCNGIYGIAQKQGIPVQINFKSSMLTVFFTEEPVVDYTTALRSDRKQYAEFFHHLLAEGIYIPPSPFESWFISTAHRTEDIEKTLEVIDKGLLKLRKY